MKIREKINLDVKGLIEHGSITVVALGDSVTHGCFRGDIDYEASYPNLLRKKILAVRDYVPVNLINAGIGGTTAATAVTRMEKQVLAHSPDLVTVCFGLNDVNGPLERYIESLERIFSECIKREIDVIFMTPNMLNTRVSEDTPANLIDYATKTAKMQNEGKMDLYMDRAVELARKMGVGVCDCYAKWKEMSEKQDITDLLANRINHPTREMHALFADMLFECIFGGDESVSDKSESGMYEEK